MRYKIKNDTVKATYKYLVAPYEPNSPLPKKKLQGNKLPYQRLKIFEKIISLTNLVVMFSGFLYK
jgi:hypothetical protein